MVPGGTEDIRARARKPLEHEGMSRDDGRIAWRALRPAPDQPDAVALPELRHGERAFGVDRRVDRPPDAGLRRRTAVTRRLRLVGAGDRRDQAGGVDAGECITEVI